MAKENRRYATMDEVKDIIKRLDHQDHRFNGQDEMLKDIQRLLKGSVSLNLQGILPMVNEMKDSMSQVVTDVAHLQRWKKREQESKGTFTIRTSVFITRILAIIGAIGVIVGAALGGLQIIEQAKKMKSQQQEQTAPQNSSDKK